MLVLELSHARFSIIHVGNAPLPLGQSFVPQALVRSARGATFGNLAHVLRRCAVLVRSSTLQPSFPLQAPLTRVVCLGL